MALPEPRISPPEPQPTTKTVTVYIRFAGVDRVELDVPTDFDLTDSDALQDYMDEWTKEHRPLYAVNADDWKYSNLTLGEFFHSSKFNKNRELFDDPEAGGSKPRIYIEAVEE